MLVVFDGTWASDPSEDGFDTNCGRLYRASKDPVKLYVSGIGAKGGLIGRWLGGAFGFGGKQKILHGLDWVLTNRIPHHGVDVLGWSRGAALACEFAHRCKDLGIPVRFLGLFDMVASFGLPGRLNLGYRLNHAGARHTKHAMAMHCSNPLFRLSRVKDADELWFPGTHRDVGAGDPALRWMWAQMISAGCLLDTPSQGNPVPTQGPVPLYLPHSRKVRQGDSIAP